MLLSYTFGHEHISRRRLTRNSQALVKVDIMRDLCLSFLRKGTLDSDILLFGESL